MANPTNEVKQILYILVKTNFQLLSVMIAIEKLVDLGRVKLEDIVESSAPIINRFT